MKKALLYLTVLTLFFTGCEIETGVPDFVYTFLTVRNQSNQTIYDVRYEGKEIPKLKAGDSHTFRLDNIAGSSALFFTVNDTPVRTQDQIIIKRGKKDNCIIHNSTIVIKKDGTSVLFGDI